MTASTRPALGPQRRRRLEAAGLVVAVAVGLVGWSHIDSGDAQAASSVGVTASTAEWSPGVGSYGIELGVDVTFDEDRVLTRGRILVDTADRTPYVSVTPQDGTDEERGYPLPRSLDAGVTVSMVVTVLPTCGVEVAAPPVFELDSRPDDGLLTAVHMLLSDPRTDTAAATDLHSWQRAVREWCGMGVHAFMSGGETTVEGGVTQTLTLYNPGPEPVTVVCSAERTGGMQWEHAEVTVPGGTTAELTVSGDQPDLDSDPPLTVKGAPVPVLHS